MTTYRHSLPQLSGGLFVTDGGLETTLVFHDGMELPEFAAFPLVMEPKGRGRLRAYFGEYLAIAREVGAGFILESVTWRASRSWGAKLDFDDARLAAANRAAIALLEEIRAEHADHPYPLVISGNIGPRGDGYVPDNAMGLEEAADYHQWQAEVLAETAANMISAFTMNYANEAAGVALAAQRAGVPVVISFTVETDGRLPTGQPLNEAIQFVDEATGGYPAYYMLNCAHPSHFDSTLGRAAPWTQRLRGLRANASCKSHAELNESTEIDIGDPEELGRQHAELTARLPHINILGGCCGTDHRHVAHIAKACAPQYRAG